MMRSHVIAIAATACVFTACATGSPPLAKQQALIQDSQSTLAAMTSRDPDLPALLRSSAGYAVFPRVGAAGAIVVGGAFGRGILYDQGRPVGYVEIKQGSIGLELGGQTYAELIVLRDRAAIDALKFGSFRLGAGASAVVLSTGAAASARFASGSSVFIMPHGGLMAGVSINGQSVGFRPLG